MLIKMLRNFSEIHIIRQQHKGKYQIGIKTTNKWYDIDITAYRNLRIQSIRNNKVLIDECLSGFINRGLIIKRLSSNGPFKITCKQLEEAYNILIAKDL